MKKRLGPILLLIGAGLMWGASRMTWVTVNSQDDKSGAAVNHLTGSEWSLELMGVTLLLLVGAVAGFALRTLSKRIVGVICALAAAAAAWSPVKLVTYGVDLQRAQDILQSAKANTNAVDKATISDWAVVTDGSVNHMGPILGLIAAAVALFGGVLLAMKPGENTAKSNKYETTAARVEKLGEDLHADPDSGRVMWDALDADIDPTDIEPTKKP